MIGLTNKNEYFYRVKIKNPFTGQYDEKYKAGFKSKKAAKEAGERLKAKLERNPLHMKRFDEIVDASLSLKKYILLYL